MHDLESIIPYAQAHIKERLYSGLCPRFSCELFLISCIHIECVQRLTYSLEVKSSRDAGKIDLGIRLDVRVHYRSENERLHLI